MSTLTESRELVVEVELSQRSEFETRSEVLRYGNRQVMSADQKEDTMVGRATYLLEQGVTLRRHPPFDPCGIPVQFSHPLVFVPEHNSTSQPSFAVRSPREAYRSDCRGLFFPSRSESNKSCDVFRETSTNDRLSIMSLNRM